MVAKYLPFIAAFLLSASAVHAGTVYVILGSDTSIWDNHQGTGVGNEFASEFDLSVFTDPEGVYRDVFVDDLRNSLKDSVGNPFKMTWYMHTGGWFQEGTNTNSASTMFLVRKHWEPELQRWGDEMAYHFHHFTWTGTSWEMAPTFPETIWDFDWAMSQMIMDERVYPVSFRSGWNYMDTSYQNYLEKWIPFRMEGSAGMSDSTPYHPSFENYARPGTMKGWEARHYYTKSFATNATTANAIFAKAAAGKDQVVCIWTHQNESDFIQQLIDVDAALHAAAALIPDAQFLYCTGKEAMNLYMAANPEKPYVEPEPYPVLIVDNDLGMPFYEESGSWVISSGVGYNGSQYRYASIATNATAKWNAFLAEGGSYEVSTCFLASPNRATGVTFVVHAKDGDHPVQVNQYSTAIQMMEVSLGTFEFDAGGGSVTLDLTLGPAESGYAISDAIIFEPQFTPQPTATPSPTPTPSPVPTVTPTATPDLQPPALNLVARREGGDMVVTIETEEDIFPVQPWIAVRDYDDDYSRADAQRLSPTEWSYRFDPSLVDRVTVGVCDLWGNVALQDVEDGSRRWSTQSEFYRADASNIETEGSGVTAWLASFTTGEPVPQVVQTESDGAAPVIERSYWIGQTFVPLAPDLSKVEFAAAVSSPARFAVELRPLLPNGFPDDNPSALIASGETTLAATGTGTIVMEANGLATDGRAYALLFKKVSGAAQVRLDTTNPYAGGMTIRAFSLAWINIPNFDCFFRVYDGDGNLSIDSGTSNGTANNSTAGRFLSQTFRTTAESLASVEVDVASATAGDVLELQLRPTLEDGSPDYAHNAVLQRRSVEVNGTGVQQLPIAWKIPEEHAGKLLALTFLSPEQGASSVRLATASTDPYTEGELFISEALLDDGRIPGSDLRFRLLGYQYLLTTGTMTFRHDAGRAVRWSGAKVEATTPEGTRIKARTRFAATSEGLATAPWIEGLTFNATARLAESEVTLEATGGDSPQLHSYELLYQVPLATMVDGMVVY